MKGCPLAIGLVTLRLGIIPRKATPWDRPCARPWPGGRIGRRPPGPGSCPEAVALWARWLDELEAADRAAAARMRAAGGRRGP
jgi:hypothetical protein